MTTDAIKDSGGRGILSRYDNRLYDLVNTVVPEYGVKPWNLAKVAPGYWNDKQNVFQFLDYLRQQESIKEEEDWYSVTTDMIWKHGGRRLLEIHEGSIAKLLCYAYPHLIFWKFRTLPRSTWLKLRTGK